MRHEQNTYIKLFHLDKNGIGDMDIIAPENVDEAIGVWCQRALNCLHSSSPLTAEDEAFYYDFVENYVKKRHIEHPDFIRFKTMYIKRMLDAIQNNNQQISSVKFGYVDNSSHPHKNSAAFLERHECLSDIHAVEELILLLVNGKDFNKDNVSVRFDTMDSPTTLHTYSARNNELVINHSFIYDDFDPSNPIEYTLQRLYAVLCLVEQKNLENEMNHDITLNALLYTIEKNYKRAFRTKAFDLMVETATIDSHTRKNVRDYLVRSLLAYPSVSTRDNIDALVFDIDQSLAADDHYTPSILQTYGSDPIESYEAVTTELTTRSLISLRANPKSMPTEIKRLLFVDGELKTFYQLKQELEDLESVKFAMTMETCEAQKSEKAKILDYLTTYCIPLKIERIVYLINHGRIDSDEYMNDLYDSLHKLREDYPNEYETTISILRNRLNKLNSYCASSTKVASYFDEIFSVKEDLTTIGRVVTYPSPIKPGLVDVEIDPNKVDTAKLPKVVYELQKLTGMGVEEIISTLTTWQQLPVLHNVPGDLAKQYTSSKVIKKGTVIRK